MKLEHINDIGILKSLIKQQLKSINFSKFNSDIKDSMYFYTLGQFKRMEKLSRDLLTEQDVKNYILQYCNDIRILLKK